MLTFRQFVISEELVKVGRQLGSNEGGKFLDTDTGKHHYIKYYKNGDQAKTEELTSKIYEHMGIKTLKPKHEIINGRHAVSTEWNDNMRSMHPHEFENLSHDQQHDIGKMYHAAILTKNWDIVGMEHDNITKHAKTGKLHSVDTGGSFNFRAQGGHKEYGPDIDEKHSFLNMPHSASTHVFRHVFKQNPEALHHGLRAVKNMDMDHVKKLFKNSGLENHEELYDNFSKRRQALLNSK